MNELYCVFSLSQAKHLLLYTHVNTHSFNLFLLNQTVTPEQVSILEAKVTQCEAALAACRLNKKNSSTSAKESVTRIKTIEIEVYFETFTPCFSV